MNLYHVTLSRQAAFLRSKLSNAIIRKSFTQVKNELIISVEKPDKKNTYLQLTCNPNLPFILYNENIERQQNSTSVLNEIDNLKIIDVQMVPGDRIIIFKFNESKLQLYIQLFTNRSNFFVIDENQQITNSFKQQRKYVGRQIEIPSAKYVDLTKINSSDFIKTVEKNPDQKLSEVLKRKFQGLNQTILNEIFFRLEIEKDDLVNSFSDSRLTEIYSRLIGLFKEMQTSPVRIYFNGQIPEKFSLISLNHLQHLRCEIFDDINDALRVYNFQTLKYRSILTKKRQYELVIRRRIESLEKSLKVIDQKIKDPSKKKDYQKIGELILTQTEKVKVNQSKVKIIDYFSVNTPEIEISVNPELSPQENAATYF
jgi:hypothetical protein